MNNERRIAELELALAEQKLLVGKLSMELSRRDCVLADAEMKEKRTVLADIEKREQERNK